MAMEQKGTFLGKLLNPWTRKPAFLILAGLLLSQSALADKATLLEKDSDALQARVDLIQQAKQEILAEYFYVGNDDQSLGGIGLLLDAAQKGIKVRVIVDSLSNSIPRSVFAILEKYGKGNDGQRNLEVKAYNPVGFNLSKATHRDHAKILVADGLRVISGGRNIGDSYFGLNKVRNFDDLDILVEGDVARQARENFMILWNSELVEEVPLYQFSEAKMSVDGCLGVGDQEHCQFVRKDSLFQVARDTARMSVILDQIHTTEPGDVVTNNNVRDWFADRENSVEAEFISHEPSVLNSHEHDELSRRLLEILVAAQNDVNITTPYLIPPPPLMEAFRNLKKRGVRVRIITNSLQSTDNLFSQAGYRSLRKELIGMGIELYEYNGPDTIHAKTAVVDNKIALMGTFNLDPRSAYLNREVAIKMIDKNGDKVATELTAAIEVFRQESTLVGKDGVEYNQDKQFVGVSKKKKIILKVLNIFLPFIKNQL